MYYGSSQADHVKNWLQLPDCLKVQSSLPRIPSELLQHPPGADVSGFSFKWESWQVTVVTQKPSCLVKEDYAVLGWLSYEISTISMLTKQYWNVTRVLKAAEMRNRQDLITSWSKIAHKSSWKYEGHSKEVGNSDMRETVFQNLDL